MNEILNSLDIHEINDEIQNDIVLEKQNIQIRGMQI